MTALLLAALCAGAAGHEPDSIVVARLEKQMYRLFNTQQTDSFLAVTDSLKTLTRLTGDERRFYKAWGNQAIFLGTRVGRIKGLDVAADMREYAQEQGSHYGLFSSSLTMASLMSSLRMESQAEEMYHRTIDYQRQFLPGESLASSYLGLAKIYYNRNNWQATLLCIDSTLQQPGLIPVHQMNAYIYRCLVLAHNGASRDEFNHAYADKQRMQQLMGHNVILGEMVDVYHAHINGNNALALQTAKAMTARSHRLSILPEAYAWNGDYREAYRAMVAYKSYADSVNNSEAHQQSKGDALEMGLARAEHEAQQLRLSEWKSKMEAQRHREYIHNMVMFFVAAILLLIIAFLAIFIRHRNQAARRLEDKNRELEQMLAIMRERNENNT